MKRFLRQFRYGEKGFTLIELLVVVAILGVLAAVAVPNIGKFMGKGKEEAGVTELHNVQTAVMAMMADNGLTAVELVAPASATQDMTVFPEDGLGLPPVIPPLYGVAGARYINKPSSEQWYSCDTDGTVRGWWDSPGTLEIGVDPAP